MKQIIDKILCCDGYIDQQEIALIVSDPRWSIGDLITLNRYIRLNYRKTIAEFDRAERQKARESQNVSFGNYNPGANT